MRKLIFLLVAVVISTQGDFYIADLRPTNSDGILHKMTEGLLDLMIAIKNPMTWELYNSPDKVATSMVDPNFKNKAMQAFRKAFPKVDQAYEALHALLKATIVGDGEPTDEEVTGWAKKFSEALRESHFTYRKIDFEITYFGILQAEPLMSNETVKILKELVAETSMKEGENALLEKLKVRLPRLYDYGNALAETTKGFIKLIEEDKLAKKYIEEEDTRRSLDDLDVITVDRFWHSFWDDEVFALLWSEENAVTFFKSWAKFAATLRDPASYGSLQALFNGFARDPRLEAYAILIREMGKCSGSYASDLSKAELLKLFQIYLEAAKPILVNGQKPDSAKFKELLTRESEVNYFCLSELDYGLQAYGLSPFLNCMVNDGDRQVFKRIFTLDEPVFTEKTLKDLKVENEKVYALVYLINNYVQGVRRRQGLGAEAQAYFQEVFTTKHVLLDFARYMKPSIETKAMFKAAVKKMMTKYNALSADARKELAETFPYRTLVSQSLLG